MRKVEIQFLDQGFHRVLFDAMPVPVFVVDDDVCILDYNAAAGRLLGKARRLVLWRRGGEVLRCVNARAVPGGCGRAPACGRCVVRESVRRASQGQGVVRRRAKMELVADGKRARVSLRVSSQPFTYHRRSFVLLILEGLDD